MSLTDLSSASIKRLVELVTQRISIEARLKKLQGSIKALVERLPSRVKPVLAETRKPAPRPRRKLKGRLLKALEAAGKKGLSVKELALNLKSKPANVSVWFYTTGKKIKGIKKVGPARYAYRSS
jgi:hypothetical protein